MPPSRPWRSVLLLLPVLGAPLTAAAARTWSRNKDWSSSDAITRATAVACPNSAKAQLSLGTMHLQHGDTRSARAAFRAALRIYPEYSDALYWLGRLGLTDGRSAQAERLLNASLELNAAHPEANLFLALCAARRGDDATALTLLARAHGLAPHNAEIARDYGAMLVRTHQAGRALPVLRRAVAMLTELHELGGRSAHSRAALASAEVKLAAALLKSNEHARCTASARKAEKLEPSIAAVVAPLRQLCERAKREQLDTSNVHIDVGL